MAKHIKTPLHGMVLRDIVAHYGLLMCESHRECPAGFSRIAHVSGRYDRMGRIHSSRLGSRASRANMTYVLVLVGGVLLNHDRNLIPKWRQIYEANVWASKEGRNTWRIIIPKIYSVRDRKRVQRLARFTHVRLRLHHPTVYQWARDVKGERHGGPEARAQRMATHDQEALRPHRSERSYDEPLGAGHGP